MIAAKNCHRQQKSKSVFSANCSPVRTKCRHRHPREWLYSPQRKVHYRSNYLPVTYADYHRTYRSARLGKDCMGEKIAPAASTELPGMSGQRASPLNLELPQVTSPAQHRISTSTPPSRLRSRKPISNRSSKTRRKRSVSSTKICAFCASTASSRACSALPRLRQRANASTS